MGGCIVHGEVVPDFSADLVTEKVSQGFAPVDVEVIQDQVDGSGCRIAKGEFEGHSGKTRNQTDFLKLVAPVF